MIPYAPAGIEQIPLIDELPWVGDPFADIATINALQIDVQRYKYVADGKVYEATSSIQIMASEGFVACSGVIMRNEHTGTDMFSHFWPGVTEFDLEDYLDNQDAANRKEIVLVYGGLSLGTGFEGSLVNDRWPYLGARAVSAETGSASWKAVFDRGAGDLVILRREPEQSMLRYHLFDS